MLWLLKHIPNSDPFIYDDLKEVLCWIVCRSRIAMVRGLLYVVAVLVCTATWCSVWNIFFIIGPLLVRRDFFVPLALLFLVLLIFFVSAQNIVFELYRDFYLGVLKCFEYYVFFVLTKKTDSEFIFQYEEEEYFVEYEELGSSELSV